MDRQDRADSVDHEMASRLLPEAVVAALGCWWAENQQALGDGTPGSHAVCYTPSRWADISPWPTALAPTSRTGDSSVSRTEVAAMVADALLREAFSEALVATYVWGKGKRGSPKGSGPTTLRQILAVEHLEAALAAAVTALREQGAQEAYEVLHGSVRGLGPAFFTKFLYFAGQAVSPIPGPVPLILDQVLALRLRALAVTVGRETGLDPDGSIAAWVWADGNWTPHRYGVYLSFMGAAARQMADANTWPPDARPDLLEYALFHTPEAAQPKTARARP